VSAPAPPAGFRVAVDIGGTFTDAVAVASDGTVRSAKVLSIPGQQDAGVVDAVRAMQVPMAEVSDFIHGTTAVLNALLERRGARLAMVVTRGFRDVYEIGRASRPEMYNIRYHRPPMLLRRRDIFEVTERLSATGEVVVALDEDELRLIAGELGGNYEAVAVCFLHAYRHDAHELRAREVLQAALPGVSVVASSQTAPEWREFERFSTTLVSAYVTPKISDYLGRLEGRLQQEGLGSPLHVMQSNGGVMTAQAGVRNAVRTLFSGPVGGTVACLTVGGQVGSDRLICIDMGGTSFDVSLVIDGRADIDSEITIAGHPVLTPSVSMHSLGAGGGSVVYVDAGGLRVGPESAGAVPGPACYGRGGVRPTVTDADLLLGRIPRDARLGGSLPLDYAAAEQAMQAVGDQLGLDATSLAAGTVAVADAMMADAIRELTVARGIDPREFDLFAFGGAGPLHAAALADELDIGRVIVPFAPGVLSAWGMLQADVRHDVVRACFTTLQGAEPAGIRAELDTLCRRAEQFVTAEGVSARDLRLEGSADLRYAGQEYTITVSLGLAFDRPALDALAADFHAAYLERYGHNNPAETVEMVNLRVTGVGLRGRPDRDALPAGSLPPASAWTLVAVSGDHVSAPVYQRSELPGGAGLSGPAVILEDGCTTFVPPGWTAGVAAAGHLVLERQRAEASQPREETQ
jgi:N-methylhydantoinase A